MGLSSPRARRTPRRPRDTSRRGCGRAAAGTGCVSSASRFVCGCSPHASGLDEWQSGDLRPGGPRRRHRCRRGSPARSARAARSRARWVRPGRRDRTAEVTRPIVLSLPPRPAPPVAGENTIALEHQPREPAVDVAAVLHTRHDLLADIAALREAHELLEARLGKDQGLVDVPAVPRNTRLDAERVERLHPHGHGDVRDGRPRAPRRAPPRSSSESRPHPPRADGSRARARPTMTTSTCS